MGTLKLTATSGGGSVSIAAPASSSNNRVITLPDITDGTLVTSQSTLDATKLSGNLPAIDGSSLTGLSGGITMADMFRYNTITTLSDGTTTDLNANWERPDVSNDAFGQLGTGMTESSGIFTFPSTGFYLVSFGITWAADGTSSTANYHYITTTENNSTYVDAAQQSNGAASGYYVGGFIQTLLDVTSTTNVKVKFRVWADQANQKVFGDSNSSRVFATFIRLGDT